MDPLIKASQISKSFNGNTVFLNVSLQINERDRMAVVGPSGCGKTTLLYILASYDRPSSGSVCYRDQQLFDGKSQLLADYRFKVGFLFQEPVLMGDMTALENILLPFVPRKGQAVNELKANAMKYADELKLHNVIKQKANTLSTGEKKRVELIRALLKEPEVVLADEPTANLDEESAEIVIDVLRRQAEAGRGLAFSVHRDQKLLSIAGTRLNISDYK